MTEIEKIEWDFEQIVKQNYHSCKIEQDSITIEMVRETLKPMLDEALKKAKENEQF